MGLAHYNYPYACCGLQDCGRIVTYAPLPDGSRMITIELQNGMVRSAVFPREMNSQPPVDDKDHACILADGKPACLFLNGGV